MTKPQYAEALVWAAALVAISHLACCAQGRRGGGGAADSAVCRPSSCGDIRSISKPFRLRGDPADCGDPRYELQCEANRTILEIPPIRYWVKAIWYEDEVIQIIDARAMAGPSFLLFPPSGPETYPIDSQRRFFWSGWCTVNLINCSSPVEHDPAVVEADSCMTTSSFSRGAAATVAAAGQETHLYWSMANSDGLPRGCCVEGTTRCGRDLCVMNRPASCADVRDALLQGFNMSWPPRGCGYGYGITRTSLGCVLLRIWYALCGIAVTIIMVRTPIGYIALLAFLVYKLRRRLLGMDDDIEIFLAKYRNCMPTRYTYRQIRKMTGNFKQKLGQGGFGSVFRGKQLTGRPVAIKILGEATSNGQDFINEVATIGRIHHANVVQLVGFCVQGSKRALVYEFMPNGSLDRYICEKEGTGTASPLSWEKTLEIAIGIARGIEYLHRGCDVKILHFDIKPQNVLLDMHFNPKISDFGLAKSYPTEKNTVTVTAVRGTIGYIAPELFYASAGGVSSKSDVYSFGMLLMEMAGRRKNVNPDAGSTSSKDYLPSWIYNQLEQGKDVAVGGATDEEKNIMNKLFIVALWCIQMKPIDRPSMGKVVEMLEGSAQQLRMPARPFLASTDLVNFEDIITATDSSEVSPMPLPHASAYHAGEE
ncbi:hypothetical protein Taro_012387 [Colocasia esculenta]|uniref:Protein kinase domain-containing protein n=1 Tax=Colocasia esculenta TaxID=4460 RepID=A0A843UDH0_COLES|nr:hypothetical protein [Colocasia esculenta]